MTDTIIRTFGPGELIPMECYVPRLGGVEARDLSEVFEPADSGPVVDRYERRSVVDVENGSKIVTYAKVTG